MSSASLELKEFKALFPRMVRELEKATGRQKPEEIDAILLFPTIRNAFRGDPFFCGQVANGNLGLDDWNTVKDRLPHVASAAREEDELITDAVLARMRPLLMELANIFYKNMADERSEAVE